MPEWTRGWHEQSAGALPRVPTPLPPCLPPLHAFCRPKGNEIICVKTIISAASAAASPCLAAFVRAVATVSIPTPAPALSLYGIP